jgi:hypothetical protein
MQGSFQAVMNERKKGTPAFGGSHKANGQPAEYILAFQIWHTQVR